MRPTLRSSGDPVADRRFDWAEQLLARRDFAAARYVYAQTLERAQGFAPAWFGLGVALVSLADAPAASAAFREALRADPADEMGASLELARIDAGAPVSAAPPAFVEALFNAYAKDFDAALADRLAYDAPRRIAQMVRAARPGARFPQAIDLGCGTGLAGEALAADIGRLEGVDISAGMLEAARARGVYDALHKAEIMTFLGAARERFSLAVAADVFCYFGDLAPAFGAVAHTLAPGGLFAFSVEEAGGDGWSVLASRRFAHSESHVRAALAAAGLSLVAIERCPLRMDGGAPVIGLIALAERERANDPAGAIDAGDRGA